MRKSWWKVPLYCVIASWICFQLTVHLFGQWAIVTLPDGSLSPDLARWRVISVALFLIIICIGGIFFFRRMTRREIFCSASVMAVLNIVFGLLANKMQGVVSLYFAELTTWSSVVSSLTFQVTGDIWIAAVIAWVIPPYMFVLFGRRTVRED